MLDYFKQVKLQEVERLKNVKSFKILDCVRPSFKDELKKSCSLNGLAVIAEYKKASPSAGLINNDITPEKIATYYEQAGANAISVLTEETKFMGHLSYIDRIHEALGKKLPLLRKDFILHPLQIEETASTRASAFLLIVKFTPNINLLRSYILQGQQYGLEAVVEIFNEEELHLARASGAKIIQVNARDLQTFKIEREKSLELGKHKQNDELWIAASGINEAKHFQEAKAAGFEAVLVGSSLMQNENPGETLKNFLEPIKNYA